MRIIVLGATGMLGFEVLQTCLNRDVEVFAVVRNKTLLMQMLPEISENQIFVCDDVKNIERLEQIIQSVNPDYLINCIGIVKQSHLAEDYYESISVNSLLPHQLQKLGQKHNFNLIHISTDCVFDGKKGGYVEADLPNAYDLYGKSKHLGEVGYGCGVTLRTSIIGHEITGTTHGLLEWFLAQKGQVNGFTKAIFSGLTTGELTRIILDIIIPGGLTAGVYHISAAPISKYDLLKIIAEIYKKEIKIIPSEDLTIDRSLDSTKFRNLTGYTPPSWKELIQTMYKSKKTKV